MCYIVKEFEGLEVLNFDIFILKKKRNGCQIIVEEKMLRTMDIYYVYNNRQPSKFR